MTLPQGWVTTALKDVCELINGRAYKKNELLSEGTWPVLRVGNLFTNPNWYYSNLNLEENKYCDKGDLIYAWSASFGPRIWNGGRVIYHYHIWKIVPNESFISKVFLFRWFEWDAKRVKAEHGTGTTMIHVTKGDMEARVIAIPPLPEQRRIVAKLDTLTAHLNRARAELNRVPVLASTIRLSALSLAENGMLSESWRSQSSGVDSTGDILELVRRKRAALQRPIRRIRTSVTGGKLPHTWQFVSPDEIASDEKYSIGIGPFGSNLTKSDYKDSGIRLVFVRDIRTEKYGVDNAKHISPAKAVELFPHAVKNGDVLITKMGDPPGDSSIYPNTEDGIITADCIKLRPHFQLADPEYLRFCIRFPSVQQQIADATKGVAQQKISLDAFRRMAFPLPPIQEQREIKNLLTAAFARADRLEAEATRARALLDRLEAAILAKAFRGELVPQDPNDEPAGVLLDRIRATRAAAPARPRRRAAATV